MNGDGKVYYNAGGLSYGVSMSYGVRQVVYLKSDIELQGSGTSSDPYQIVS